MRFLYFLSGVFLFISCQQQKTAQEIVDEAINASGLSVLENRVLSFKFRNNEYIAKRKNGSYELLRIIKNDSTVITDILSNNGFQRTVNEQEVALTEKEERAYSNSVNSVHYFSVLPLGLNDKAVHKELLKEVSIKGEDYYKIKVTFAKEGGGEDFDDVFLYWFHKKTKLLHYLAYKYHTNGGGIRFRDIKKEHLINGVRLVDYTNYKPESNEIPFEQIDELYGEDKLIRVSEIVLDNIQIVE